jgi:hypothetical protein
MLRLFLVTLKKDGEVRSLLFLVALWAGMADVAAGAQVLATVGDPAGDDNGAGTLVYPQRNDFQSGDLDLIRLQVTRDSQGFWFEAMFKNQVRDPANVAATVGGDTLADFARKGFYQFNVDVYVDMDRIPGSGNRYALPGRAVRIEAGYAWERAVVLTPRPELMRQQLIGALAEQHPETKSAEVEASVDQSVFFPTRIKVRGKTIAFFVPSGFFSGSDGSSWAATALVTGAITAVPADFSLSGSTKKPLGTLQLGVMQPALGHPQDTFGYSGSLPSPVVDMLTPAAELQAKQLAAKEGLTGVSWGLPGARTPLPAAAAPILQLDTLLRETTVASEPAVPGGANVQSSAAPTIAERLQELQQLLDRKLIDEDEYRQQKQRILNEL